MIDVAPMIDPAHRAIASATSGTRRDSRAVAREWLTASRELRRAAHEMRRAVERADAAALGRPALAPLSARIGDTLADVPQAVRSTSLAATSAAASVRERTSKAASAVSKKTGKRASRARKASKKAARIDIVSALDVGSLAGLARAALSTVRPTAPARPAVKTRRRGGPSLGQVILFVVVPLLLVTPLVMLIARRRGSWMGDGQEASPEVDGAATMGAAGTGAGAGSPGWQPEGAEPTGEPSASTVAVPDATDPQRLEDQAR
jgi:hypothetical protein